MRYEIDKNTGFFVLGYGYGSSPTFSSLTVSGATTVGGQLTVNNNAVVNGNLTVSGSFAASGLSDNQARNARAPRQGLVFDGTAGATVASVPAFGTADYSIAAWLVWSGSSAQTIVDGSSSVAFFVNGSGAVAVYDRISSSTKAITANGVVTAGKPCFVTYTRAGQIYVNGLASGAVVADTSNYTGTIGTVGQNYDGSQKFSGFLAVNIYNRALSASEVVALYEAGAPAGADYPASPAGTVITKTPTLGTWTGTVVGSTYTISTASTGFIYGGLVAGGSLPKGKIRVNYDLTINSGTGPTLGDGNVFSTGYLVAGTGKTIEFTNPSANNILLVTNGYAAGNYVLTINSVTMIGLLLAPDAAQAGGGLVWYDTSGNAANITLPASGVSWNVPFAGYLNSSSSLNLSAGGTNQNITLTPSGTGFVTAQSSSSTGDVFKVLASGGAGLLFGQNSSAGQGPYIFSTGALRFGADQTERGRFATSTGNLLLGTTTDSGNGKLQLATHTTSAGGIGFGTDIALYRAGGNTLKLELGVSAGVLWFDNGGNGTGGARILGSSGALTVTSNGANSLYLQTGGTTALTLDSSLNATFAGNVTAIKAGTAFYSIESTVNGALSEVIVKGKNSVGTAREARLGLNKYADDVFSIYDGTTERFRLGLTNGDATFAGSIRQNQANNISLTSGVATTIFSLGTSAGVYIVTATLDVNGNSGYAIVGKGATGNWQVLANSGSQISFSMSTNDLQITQSSGSTSTTNTFNLLRLR